MVVTITRRKYTRPLIDHPIYCGAVNVNELETRQGQSGSSVATRRNQQNEANRTHVTKRSRQRGLEYQYCTQKCLSGLINDGPIDHDCPNASLHGRQPINHATFLELLWKQLEASLDDGIWPLGIGGSRGVLFKVTLLEFGYTFVSKGTVRAFVVDLEHEAAVYARLKPLQDTYVPVFLGATDLQSMGKTYYYDHRVYVVHMSFMSWGGTRPDPHGGERLREKAALSLRAIHNNGVIHGDVRGANMLCSDEMDGIMVIDFERALLVPSPRPPLSPARSPIKRLRTEDPGQERSSSKRGLQHLLASDRAAVSHLFEE
ncbi:hypothetical protein GMORB2_2734 [Geosmithia morbida]|uniref:non-specific serine/threonine protein kinase n=1 Tax=Geosmithia morbida TaxID=1094350 RepID=A0A9P4YRH0_9HYPO|nr:uncharacterized protein GMORB2_2734 [Geosmithia morbida]KAF4120730.1 hypothetical protein GMORB2_2734 [Geosmithia morbida]